MKVKCVQLLDGMGKLVDRSSWAKLGNIYHVLELWIEPGQTRLRLLGEEAVPALYQPEMFEVVSSIIPSTWVITSPKPGCFSLQPEAWTRPGFWEEFYDRKPEAIACFQEERQKIVNSDP